MKLRRWLSFVAVLAFGHPALAETISHGRFEQLKIYRPHGEARHTVLFFSGQRGWSDDLEPIAQSLARQGALVAGIDSAVLFRNLEQDGGDCVSPDGDLENLSRFLQAYYRLPAYRPALLIGTSAGASFTYAMLAQAPTGTFAGGISLGFCPSMPLRKPLCPSDSNADATTRLNPKKLDVPWTVFQGLEDRSCRSAASQFIGKVTGADVVSVPGDDYGDGDFHTWEPQFASAYQKLAAKAPAPPKVSATELRDLPIVEVPATGTGDTLALLISGDGGWAGIDKALATAITKQGMPVIGLDSLRYFWKARTPDGTAADVDRILRHYLTAWNKRSVLLIGFSQGADVMPFIVNRLPAATRDRLRMVALLSLSRTAVFEFHLSNWLGRADDDQEPIAPELARMTDVRALCVYGEDEEDSLCTSAAARATQVIKLKGGHHFDGDYAALAALILSHAR